MAKVGYADNPVLRCDCTDSWSQIGHLDEWAESSHSLQLQRMTAIVRNCDAALMARASSLAALPTKREGHVPEAKLTLAFCHQSCSGHLPNCIQGVSASSPISANLELHGYHTRVKELSERGLSTNPFAGNIDSGVRPRRILAVRIERPAARRTERLHPFAYHPLSTYSASPLTKLASSEARKTTAAATSSGSQIRPCVAARAPSSQA